MKRGDILLEKTDIVQNEYSTDPDLVASVRRHQRHAMLDELMNLNDLPFHKAMARIERWDEDRQPVANEWARHLPEHQRPVALRTRVVVSKP